MQAFPTVGISLAGLRLIVQELGGIRRRHVRHSIQPDGGRRDGVPVDSRPGPVSGRVRPMGGARRRGGALRPHAPAQKPEPQ